MNNNFDKFNLIPPKTKEEIVTIEERDNSVLYAVILIFLAVTLFAFFSIGKALLVDTRKVFLESAIAQQDNSIAAYNSIKRVNGEIFIKSNALAPIVQQDIKLTSLIEVANELIVGAPNAIITSYARELDGKFLVTIEIDQYSDINIVSRNADQIETLSDFYIKEINQSSAVSKSVASISFVLTNIK